MKFIISSGGTGGHIIPAVRVGEQLLKDGHTVEFAGAFKSFEQKITEKGFVVKEFSLQGFSLKNFFGATGCMIRALKESLHYLKETRPDAVLGFGGYAAFPIVLAAVLLKIPAVIHEQNVIPGKANKILSKFVKKVAVSFKASRKFFGLTPTVLTGCPCHLPSAKTRQEILGSLGLKESHITILVIGGSQGSQKINKEFVQIIDLIKTKIALQVIHLSGKEDEGWIKQEYAKQGIPFCVFDFSDRIPELFTVTDLVIARAGAVTVSEIAHFEIPAILIPYPYAQKHQMANAEILAQLGVARIIDDMMLNTQTLCTAVLELTERNPITQEKKAELKTLQFPDAAQALARLMVELTS